MLVILVKIGKLGIRLSLVYKVNLFIHFIQFLDVTNPAYVINSSSVGGLKMTIQLTETSGMRTYAFKSNIETVA